MNPGRAHTLPERRREVCFSTPHGKHRRRTAPVDLPKPVRYISNQKRAPPAQNQHAVFGTRHRQQNQHVQVRGKNHRPRFSKLQAVKSDFGVGLPKLPRRVHEPPRALRPKHRPPRIHPHVHPLRRDVAVLKPRHNVLFDALENAVFAEVPQIRDRQRRVFLQALPRRAAPLWPRKPRAVVPEKPHRPRADRGAAAHSKRKPLGDVPRNRRRIHHLPALDARVHQMHRSHRQSAPELSHPPNSQPRPGKPHHAAEDLGPEHTTPRPE